MGKSPPWAQVKLRVSFGDIPDAGDELVMVSTGRRYQVLRVSGRTLRCLVLPADAETDPESRVWSWQWTSRKRKAARG